MSGIGKILVFATFIVFGLTTLNLQSQIKVQVVSQKISKKVDYVPGMTIMMSGEHAEIHCSNYPGNQIILDLTIVSKNESRDVAEVDLKKMKWLAEVKGNIFFIRNYIELAKGESMPESMLKAVFDIKLPESCNLNIKNSFGKTELDSINAGITVRSEYSPLYLNNIRGTQNINALFSDISATGIGGNVILVSTYGKILLKDFNELKSLSIEGNNLNMEAFLPEVEKYSLSLDLKTTKLSVPQNLILNYTDEDNDRIKADLNYGKPLPLFHIKLENSVLKLD